MVQHSLWSLLVLLLTTSVASPVPIEDSLPVQDVPSDGSSKIKIPEGYTRTLFEDDFSTQKPGSLPSSAKWTIDIGTSYPGGPARWGTNEVQTYTSSTDNLAITTAGTLLITPVLTAGKWTSARIETTAANDFVCAPGKKLLMTAAVFLGAAERSMQAGIWPAFWSLGSAYRGKYTNWPSVGEIDVLETVGGAPTAWQTVHCGSGSGGPCHETNGLSTQVPLTRGAWHEVSVEIDRSNVAGDWKGEKLTWLVDGKPTSSVSGSVVGDAKAWEALARTPKFLLLNVAVGGSFPDAVQKSKTPNAATKGGSGVAMEVKYVAVFTT